MARIKSLFANFHPFCASFAPFATSSLSLLIAILVVTLAPARAEDEKAAKDEAAAEDAKSQEDAILADIPPDQVYHGLRIPHMDPTGRLLMLFDAGSAKRIDDRNIEMEDLKIEIHNDDGTTFHVEMPRSVFNLDTRVLTSDTPVTIRREDFIINGETAEFHTKTRFGRMRGNVKMTINTERAE